MAFPSSKATLEGALTPSNQKGAMPLTQPPSGTAKRCDLSAVLGNTTPHPFSYNDFLEFLKKEHSVENIDFWEAGMKYREKALPLFPKPSKKGQKLSEDLNKAISASTPSQQSEGGGSSGEPSNPEDEQALKEKQNALRPELEHIVQLFLTAGSHKEVNLPQNVVKRVVGEILDNRNYHPDVLKPVLEKTYEMMKTCTFPNFYKSAVEQAKLKNLPVLENGYTRKKKAAQAAAAAAAAAQQSNSATAPSSNNAATPAATT